MGTLLGATGTAILVLLVGSLPWAGFGRVSGLGAWNLRVGILLPWAVVPMALYLWLYFGYIGGRWGDANAARRRENLKANPVPRALWVTAIPAGLAGFGAILALLAVFARLVPLPAGAPITTPAGMPVATTCALLAMQSVVAGVTEESAFRGYMQSIVARRFGVPVAITASGILFGLLHFPNHPSEVVLMLPYYVAVSAVYGALTWAADSIWPAIVLHSVGDVVVLMRWWLTGLPEWQLTATPPTLVRDGGIDASFIGTLGVAVFLSGLTVWAYGRVNQLRLRLSAAPGLRARERSV